MANQSQVDVLRDVEAVLNTNNAVIMSATHMTEEAIPTGIGWECKAEVDPLTGRVKIVCGIGGTF